MEALGGADQDFVNGLLSQLANAGSKGRQIDERGLNFMLSVAKGIQPKDQVEAMLAAQMAAIHMATMTFARRLQHVNNIPQQDSAERAFNKLARTFATQMEALKRYRTGGEQKVTVQHVSVQDGGRAIVGNVTQSPREPEPQKAAPSRLPTHGLLQCQSLEKTRSVFRFQRSADQANDRRASAQHRSDAVEPALRRQDAVGQALHVSGRDREKTLSHARRRAGLGGSTRQQKRTEAWVAYARSH